MHLRTLLPAAALAALLPAGAARAQAPEPPGAPPLPGLEALLDSVFARAMAEGGTPGATVAVVKDGRVVLVRGYGYADLEARTPVDPERTVFRVGSVAKPVTALAAMQLVEAGRLDPAADVNRYLRGFRVPEAFGRPVTAAHLATHTAGFDVRLAGTAAARDADVLPLERYLARDLPPRVRPPGAAVAYSNHGYALLGHLVERVSGEEFEAYAQAHVFRPLGMRSSSFRLGPELERRLAAGYEPGPAGPRRTAVVHPHITPAAGLNTTAADMARLMAALLEDDPRVLGARGARELRRRWSGMDPAMPGMAWGTWESRENGVRTLGHSGGIRGFMSGVYLWPERRMGLFVSGNGYDGALVRSVFFAVLDRYFPSRPPALFPPPDFAERAPRFAGSYRVASHPRTHLERAGALRGGDLRVRDRGDGTIEVFGVRFVETSPLHFRELGGDELLAFQADAEGRIARMLTTDPVGGNQAWERLPWWDAAALHQALLACMALALLSGVLAGPRGPVAPPLRGRAAAPPGAARARRVEIAAAGLPLAFLAGMAAAFRGARDTGLLLGVPPLMAASLAVGAAGALLAPGLAWYAARAWREGWWRPAWRAHFTVVAAAALGWAALLHHWNLLGLRF